MKIGLAKVKKKRVSKDLKERESKCGVCGEDRWVITLGIDICSDCSIDVMMNVIAFNMHLFAGRMMSRSTLLVDSAETKCSVCGKDGCTFEMKSSSGDTPLCYQCAVVISEFARTTIPFDDDEDFGIINAAKDLAQKYLCMSCDEKDSCDHRCLEDGN